jgi:hypothetical protein
MQVKQALDAYFANVKFDDKLFRRLTQNNIEYISGNEERAQLFSGRNIGCYFIKYTQYDKNIFYNNLFGLEFDDISDEIEKISSIPKHFKIARDDVNLMCFYIAHRFLSNPDLDEKQQMAYAREALNYFNYRTLVLLSSTYFIYPISEDKATSMSERLSNKYIIKKLKNWNEYCQYRSDEYLDSKFLTLLRKMDSDDELPNAITDLFGRTKDTIKNIYGEFTEMLESDEVIKSRQATVKDGEGNMQLADRIDSVQRYTGRVDTMLSDKTVMIKKDHITVVVDILSNLSYRDMHECLDHLFEFAFSSRKAHDRVHAHFKDILVNAMEYLQRNEVYLHSKTNVLDIMNSIVGNVLYARGTEVSVHRVKNEGEQLIKAVYKHHKDSLSDRTLKSVRNGLYLYVVLTAFTS